MSSPSANELDVDMHEEGVCEEVEAEAEVEEVEEEDEDYEYEYEHDGVIEYEDCYSSEEKKSEEVAATSATSSDWQVETKFLRAGTNKRLMQDLMAIMRHDTTQFGFVIEQVDEDVMNCWRVKLFNFEDGTLAADMQELQRRKGIDFVEMEMKFEQDYPFTPPFLRVVYPRFKFHTGHVTIGGSVCMELLTVSGWRPTNDIESVLIQIRAEMMEGGAQVDFAADYCYSEQEARAAFHRVAKFHGWEK